MPYGFSVVVDSTEAADEARRVVRKYRRVYRRPCLTKQSRASPKGIGATIWWKSHRSTGVTLGRVFKQTPEGLLVQNNETTEFVTEKSGSMFAGMSKEAAEQFGAQLWWAGLSPAQQASIREEFARRGVPLPPEYGG